MSYRFHHWLERRVGYEALLVAARAVAHRAAAEAIEAELLAPERPPESDALRRDIFVSGPLLDRLAPASPDLSQHWESALELSRSGLFALIDARSKLNISRFAEGEGAARRAAELLRTAGDVPGTADAQGVLGSLFDRRARYAESLEAFEAARRTLANDASPDSAAVRIHLEGGYGWTLLRLARDDESKASLDLALALARQNGPPRLVAYTLSRLAGWYTLRDQHRPALALYEEALIVHRASGNPHAIASIYNGMGIVYSKLGQSNRALQLFTDAASLLAGTGDLFGEASTQNNLGNAYFVAGRMTDAERGFCAAPELSSALGGRGGVRAPALKPRTAAPLPG